MEARPTTEAIQGYLDALAGLGGGPLAEPVVRSLLGRAAGRLHKLCASLLHRSYPRLTRAPLNLEAEEMLSAVVERLMKALRAARPQSVPQFFKIANQHMRWELNDLCRRLENRTQAAEMSSQMAALPESSASPLTPVARRIFDTIDQLPEAEREAFELIRIQGMTSAEAAALLDVTARTMERRVNRAVLLLTQRLGDLQLQPDT
jgi:RNA polymerase sigma-70 factor (ECF subfamily)